MNNRAIVGDYTPDLFLHFIQQDFATGATVISFDGTLARLLADIIPPEHTQHTFYFDPSDEEHIASFNVFRKVKQKDKARLVEDLCAFFDAMFPAGDTTITRLYSSALLPTILTILTDNPDVSLKSVLKFLSDEAFRNGCLENCTSDQAKENWAASKNYPPQFRDGALALIDTTLRKLLLHPIIHRTLEKGNGFYPAKTRILIADLSRARLGDPVAKLLGTLLFTRARTPVYVDNFEFIASDYTASLFSQGGYTIGTRFLSTLPPNVAQQLLAFDEKFVFRTTEKEAEQLKFYVGQYQASVLMDLRREDPANGIKAEFLPPVALQAPAVSGRSRAVLRRSIARHTRKSDNASGER